MKVYLIWYDNGTKYCYCPIKGTSHAHAFARFINHMENNNLHVQEVVAIEEVI